MERITIKQLNSNYEKFAGEKVTVCGWTRSVRDSKTFGFIDLNDGSSFVGLQVVFEAEKIANFDEIAHLNVSSSVVVEGVVVLTPDNKQPYEIKATAINVEGLSTPEYPLQKKRHSIEFLREVAHLRPRTNLFNAIMRVRSELAYALHAFFHQEGFVYVHTPLITGSDCEGAGEMFKVTTMDMENVPMKDGKIDYSKDFFGKQSSLTVSGQLNAETYALAFGKVYTFGPTFRAENSNTTRHAAEFWMIEPEIAFADLNDDMQLAEAMIKFVINHILATCPDEMKFFNSFVDKTLLERLTALVTADFTRMTYTDAIEVLSKHNDKFDYPVTWGCDLQTEHERYLTEKVCNGPVFVTDYPKDIKAFYMRMNEDNRTVAAVDMLVPGVGELIGGSQREERLERLLARLDEMKLDPKDYWWYLELRKYGSAKHAGFGLGFERLVMYVTGTANIRDVIPFPRTVGNAQF